MSEDQSYTEIDCMVAHETEGAIKIVTGCTTCWIPKSQLKDQVTKIPSDTTIEVPEWLAIEKGLV